TLHHIIALNHTQHQRSGGDGGGGAITDRASGGGTGFSGRAGHWRCSSSAASLPVELRTRELFTIFRVISPLYPPSASRSRRPLRRVKRAYLCGSALPDASRCRHRRPDGSRPRLSPPVLHYDRRGVAPPPVPHGRNTSNAARRAMDSGDR
ncbi:unnamed protein product, partial [Urochloa humidicola]